MHTIDKGEIARHMTIVYLIKKRSNCFFTTN